MARDLSDLKVCIFDVFGTVVDWRSSLIADFNAWSKATGKTGDWTALVDALRGSLDSAGKATGRTVAAVAELATRLAGGVRAAK